MPKITFEELEELDQLAARAVKAHEQMIAMMLFPVALASAVSVFVATLKGGSSPEDAPAALGDAILALRADFPSLHEMISKLARNIGDTSIR